MSKILPEGVTQDQVNTWKEKYGKVKVITVKRENGKEVQFVIGQPTREILDSWAHYHNNDQIAKARGVLKAAVSFMATSRFLIRTLILKALCLRKCRKC
ncbi:MAG: hypothetical protein L6Q66_08620, partial [Bacteroidia bacterium]|nr:hypothetical protein [Bacteroidia bacterium]